MPKFEIFVCHLININMKKEVFRFSLKMNFGLFKSVAAFLRYFMSGQSTPISLMTNVCNILTMPVEVKISSLVKIHTKRQNVVLSNLVYRKPRQGK